MTQHVISNLRLKPYSSWEPTKTYEVKEHGKFVWLQKLCFKFLSKYGKPYIEEKHCLKTEVINTENTLDLIFETIKGMESVGVQCKRVLIGNEQMQELFKINPGFYQLRESVKYNTYRGVRIFDIEIILIPWINGVICLPDL